MNNNDDNKFRNPECLKSLDRQINYTTPVLDRPVLRFGDQGEYVRLLQTQLKHLMFFGDDIDGYFDGDTELSVKAFQTNNKLTADGIVGKDTWSSLIYLYAPLSTCVGNYHTVQRGDTLWSIARQYNTTVAEIKRLNNLTSDLLSVGQQLILPGIEEIIPPGDNIIHIVQKGDTLWSITRQYDTTVDEIKRLNNLTSNLLSVGQRLIISGMEETIPSEDNIIYTVQRGDTLWSIAREFNTTVTTIRNYNNLTSDLLSVGQQLTIPKTEDVTTYVVQRGDSLWAIANRFNTTVDEIKNLNNLKSNILSIGQVLKIKN